MLKREHQEILIRTGPGTPMGVLFRRYWIPALLAEELPEPDCAPGRVQLLGERAIDHPFAEEVVKELGPYKPKRR